MNGERTNLTRKLIGIGILLLICFIPTLFVASVVAERADRLAEVQYEIGEAWGAPQTIAGPVLLVEDELALFESNNTTYELIVPDVLEQSNTVTVEERARGIFTATVYTNQIESTGWFTPTNEEVTTARLVFLLSDSSAVRPDASLLYAGEQYPLLTDTIAGRPALSTEVPLQPGTQDFKIALTVQGSQSLSITPVGERTSVGVEANWPDPSFIGASLPSNRELADTGFSARWEERGIFAQNSLVSESELSGLLFKQSASFGVEFFQTNTIYTQIDRVIKYALLFLCLTFITFFLYEVLANLRLHAVHYILVGLALALFYLLLLSIAEILTFGVAYLIAAFATIGLITMYTSAILNSVWRALSLAGVLVGVYTYLFILLQLEKYSLLFGSLFLFGVLAIVMFITKDIKWHELEQKK